MKSNLTFIGGEVFVRKDMIELLKFADKLGVTTSIVSNGTLINKETAGLLGNFKSLKEITISIDGSEEIHDNIKGKGNFKRCITTIEEIASERSISSQPWITTNTTITPEIIGNMENLLESLNSVRGLNMIKIQHLWFTNRNKAKQDQSVLQNEFGITEDPGVNSHVIEGYVLTDQQLDVLDDEFTRAQKVKYRVPFGIYPLFSILN